MRRTVWKRAMATSAVVASAKASRWRLEKAGNAPEPRCLALLLLSAADFIFRPPAGADTAGKVWAVRYADCNR